MRRPVPVRAGGAASYSQAAAQVNTFDPACSTEMPHSRVTRTPPHHAGPGGDAAAKTLFAGSGEMRALARELDWSATPLGPVEEWPLSLCTIVRAMMASRNPMFLFWGPELVQIYNDAYRPSLGSVGADGIGRHPRALGMRGAEFWTDIWDAIGPQIEQVMTTGEATWHEDQYLPIERNNGREDVWWTYSYGPAFDDAGKVAGTLVVCQETTARMLADRERQKLHAALAVERERLAEVFRQSPSFLAVARGPDHVFEFVNDAYYALVGRRDIIGKPVREALPEIGVRAFIAILDEVFVTGVPFVGREMSIDLARTPGAPPEQVFVDFVYLPMVEMDGTCSGIIAHGTDVTEQVRARREVERLLKQSELARIEAEEARSDAEEANRSKGQFLATMSHELRTPLNAIGGYVELLEMEIRGPITNQQREDLARIQHSQRHLLGLINEVLNYARIEMGAVQYQIGEVQAAQTLALTESLVTPQAQSRGLRLVMHPCDAELCMRADAEKVTQILANLIGNAVKFTDPGGLIEIFCVREGEWIAFRVRDNGCGIAAGKLEVIFDPFIQVNADLTRTAGGVGLGLAISRDLARAMGGELAVESTLGEGSVFTLSLPATQGDGAGSSL